MFRVTPAQLNLLCILAALALLALPVFAQSAPADQILIQLQQKGYSILLQERTWLGRGRIVAIKDGMRREVVFHPGTGEILRDYAAVEGGADNGSRTKEASSSGGLAISRTVSGGVTATSRAPGTGLAASTDTAKKPTQNAAALAANRAAVPTADPVFTSPPTVAMGDPLAISTEVPGLSE